MGDLNIIIYLSILIESRAMEMIRLSAVIPSISTFEGIPKIHTQRLPCELSPDRMTVHPVVMSIKSIINVTLIIYASDKS